MPQSHWLHFYFHWGVKPKLSKLLAVVEGYWSLFWPRFAAAFHLSLTAAPEPQRLEAQEKSPGYLFHPFNIPDFPARNPQFILCRQSTWKNPPLSNCSIAVCLHGEGIVWAVNCAGFPRVFPKEMNRWVRWDTAAFNAYSELRAYLSNLHFLLEDANPLHNKWNPHPCQGTAFQSIFMRAFPRQIDVCHPEPCLIVPEEGWNTFLLPGFWVKLPSKPK